MTKLLELCNQARQKIQETKNLLSKMEIKSKDDFFHGDFYNTEALKKLDESKELVRLYLGDEFKKNRFEKSMDDFMDGIVR